MMQTIVVKNSIRRKFQDFWGPGRVLFLSAPCGFGKTTLAQTLLDGKRVLALTPDQPDFSLPPQSQDWEVLLLDDAQLMQEEEQWQALCTLIRTSPQRRFVVLSRGAPPGCLMAFRYAGLMTVLEPDDLLFGREDIRQLFQQEGVAVTDSEISGILKESIGYPLGVAVTARNMAGGHALRPGHCVPVLSGGLPLFRDGHLSPLRPAHPPLSAGDGPVRHLQPGDGPGGQRRPPRRGAAGLAPAEHHHAPV